MTTATTTTTKYPLFDLLEATTDQDLSYKNYQSLKPVKTGDFILRTAFDYAYSRWQHFSNGVIDESFVATKQLNGQPLVVSFYSKHWNGNGVEYLKQLGALHKEVKDNGGNLIVISDESFSQQLAAIVSLNNLSLTFYFDESKSIARQMGVYSENDPIWNWFAGIDQNVPLLSTFVIGTQNYILFDHNYRDYDASLPGQDIVNAVRDSAFISNLLLSA